MTKAHHRDVFDHSAVELWQVKLPELEETSKSALTLLSASPCKKTTTKLTAKRFAEGK